MTICNQYSIQEEPSDIDSDKIGENGDVGVDLPFMDKGVKSHKL